MASTVLPNGIIIPEKYSRDWYNDLYHNWQELDNLLGGGGGGGANDGTLTIQKNGTTVGTFSANQATNETINITVPTVNNATLTIQRNGTTVDTFTANASVDKTINISTTDDTKIPLTGSNQISGDLIPSTDGTVNLGSSSKKFASLNGIAPDELGLPTSTYTDVSSYITHFDGIPNTFTAPVSGILEIDANGKTVVTNNILTVNAVANDGLYRSIMPVAAGDTITIYTLTSSINAIIHHLKGKI